MTFVVSREIFMEILAVAAVVTAQKDPGLKLVYPPDDNGVDKLVLTVHDKSRGTSTNLEVFVKDLKGEQHGRELVKNHYAKFQGTVPAHC